MWMERNFAPTANNGLSGPVTPGMMRAALKGKPRNKFLPATRMVLRTSSKDFWNFVEVVVQRDNSS
jgi:hypothetical protein